MAGEKEGRLKFYEGGERDACSPQARRKGQTIIQRKIRIKRFAYLSRKEKYNSMNEKPGAIIPLTGRGGKENTRRPPHI